MSKERIDELPSGVLIVTTETAQAASLPEPLGVQCAHCDRRSNGQIAPLQHRTEDGFHIVWPTCGHDKYVLCPDCYGKPGGCPVCGEPCEYT